MAWTKKDSGSRATAGTQLPAVAVYSEETLNDSNKSFSVTTDPASGGEDLLEIIGIRVELATTATVGNRQLTVEVQDSDSDVVSSVPAHVTQAASLSYVYEFSPNGVAATVGTTQIEHMPAGWVLQPDETLRVYDSAAVDAAADDMVVHVRARRWSR